MNTNPGPNTRNPGDLPATAEVVAGPGRIIPTAVTYLSATAGRSTPWRKLPVAPWRIAAWS